MPSGVKPFVAPNDEETKVEERQLTFASDEVNIPTSPSFSPPVSPTGPRAGSRQPSEAANSPRNEPLDAVPLPQGVPQPIEVNLERSQSQLSAGTGSLLSVPQKIADNRSSLASTQITAQDPTTSPGVKFDDDLFALQRPRSSSVADRIEAVMREGHSRFFDGSKSGEKWLLAVFLCPMLAVIPFWIPGLPDADETSTSYMVWHFITLFVMDHAGSTMYPFVPGALLTVPLFRSKLVQFLMVPYLSAGIVIFGGVIPYLIFNVFPVPMLAVIQAAAIIPLVIVYFYYFMNPDVLNSKSHRADFFVSVGILIGVTVVYGVIYPLGGALFNQLEGVPQAFMALAFCVVRGIYEKIGTRVLASRAQDGFPLFIFSSCFCHETFIAILMNRVSAWYVFAVFILYDLSENLYHVWELRKYQSMSAECAKTARHLVTVALLMEFAEMIAPFHYTVCSIAIYFLNKRPNDNFALVKDDDFWKGIFFNCLDVVGEVCVFMYLTVVIKKVTGLRAIKALGRLCVIYGVAFLAFQITILGFFLQIQYAPGGNDLTFQFNWLKDGAKWVGGLCWTTPEDPLACES